MSDPSPAIDSRLVESEQRYRTVIQNASDMIQSVRPDGTFEFVNQAWLDAFGYTQNEVANLIIWDIVHPESIAHCQILFAKAMQGETIPYLQTTFVAKDGHPVPVEGNVSSRFIGDTIIATHGFFRDISERLHTQELEKRNVELEREQQARYLEKMAALGKLAAGLAHELNNPAAAIQRAGARINESLDRRDGAMHQLVAAGIRPEGWHAIETMLTEVQAGDVELNPLEINERETTVENWLDEHDIAGSWDIAPGLVQAGITGDQLEELARQLPATMLGTAIAWLTGTLTIRESADIIGLSSRRISELVNAVKGYSWMDRSVDQVADVHGGLESTLIVLGHRLRNITMRREYDRNLPPVRTFGNTLNQVWTNIIDNAIDATGERGTISIRTRLDGDHVVVEIEDDGSGISPENLACIFEPFFTTKPQGQGTGLGLDMTWRIITEEHGGTIGVESEPGLTRFRISLPTASPDDAPPA